MGLLGALIAYGRRTGHAALTQQLVQSALITFVMGFMIANVNNWAHAGGLAAGWLCAEAMPFSDQRREGLALQLSAIALILVTLGAFIFSFAVMSPILAQR